MSCEFCKETLYKLNPEYKSYQDDEFIEIDAKFCRNCGELITELQPLSLEQLKQMNSMPVWVVDIQYLSARDIFACVVVINNQDENYCIHPMGFGGRSFPFHDYGKRWLAFTHKIRNEDIINA